MPELNDVAALCEAILAVAGEPVSLDALHAAVGEDVSAELLAEALEAVRLRHEHDGSGLLLERTGGGYRLATRPELDAGIRSFLGVRASARLSQAALETLAIIAYRQPVTLPEINFLRGVNSTAVMRTLLDKKLVRVAGRKQVVGTPLVYRTTKEFLIHFGIDQLSELPTPEELGEPSGDGASGP